MQKVSGNVQGAAIKAGATQSILFGGYASANDIRGTQELSGNSYADTVNKGGRQNVKATGIATSAILNGGAQYVEGKATSTVISKGGVQHINANGIADSSTLLASGKLVVYSGGIASNVNAKGKATVDIKAGGSISNLSMNSGGTLTLAAGCSVAGNNSFASVTATGGSKKGNSITYASLAKGAALTLGVKNNMSKLCLSITDASLSVVGAGNKLLALETNANSALTFDVSQLSASGNTLMLAMSTAQEQKASFSIEVSNTQQHGTYELCTNMLLANGTEFALTVGDASVSGLTLGGAGVVVNGILYTVNSTGKNSQINLTIDVATGNIVQAGLARSIGLAGSEAWDIFYGNAQDNLITGNGGRDVAVYDNTAWGNDTIRQTSGSMTLLFNGLTASQVTQSYDEATGSMTISRNGSTDSIIVENWNAATDSLVFGSGLNAFQNYLNAGDAASLAQEQAATKEVWSKAGVLAG